MGEPVRDADFFKPLNLLDDPVDIERVPLAQAEGIVCCGPFDTQADPDVNRPDFLYAREKGLKLLCANPDIIVDRGETREWCAGALAALYTEMGGESLYFGKPYPPIYDLARRRLAALTNAPSDPRIICIGDGIRTDVLGGMQEDLRHPLHLRRIGRRRDKNRYATRPCCLKCLFKNGNVVADLYNRPIYAKTVRG